MNLKILAERISEAKLWDKPLKEFSEIEILSLTLFFNLAAMDGSETSCGSCWYYGWKGTKPWCLHSDHPGRISAYAWGYGCVDWSDFCDKELGPHNLNRKPKMKCHDEARHDGT